MREQVTIVLNEREPLKAKAAQTLLENLSARNITASRVEIDQHIEKKLLEIHPTILILDYVLGDYSTGLDIVEAFQRDEKKNDTQFLFLTDEPSVEVAVNAMRLGARHYVSTDVPNSLKILLTEIDSILKRQPQRRTRLSLPPLSLNDLTALSPCARKMVERSQTLTTKREPIVVLVGPSGSGKHTLARAMLQALPTKGNISERDFSLYTGDVEQCTRLESGGRSLFELGTNLSLLLSHIEEDDGELLEHLAHYQRKWWPNGASSSNESFVIGITTCMQTAETWQRALNAEIVQVPPLDSNRSDDFPGLIQAFSREAKKFIGTKAKQIDGESVTWLSQQHWSRNITQLRSVILDALICQSHSNASLQEILEEHYSLSEEHASLNRE
ncbi:MAG: hypothetical protein KDD55_04120, partial [Bdellovibrionales bacterium]|nr:hypothetical protein [Bdellovibrionales bacterium]